MNFKEDGIKRQYMYVYQVSLPRFVYLDSTEPAKLTW